MSTSWIIVAIILITLAAISCSAAAADEDAAWQAPQIVLKRPARHPVIAATADELGRLRKAWKSQGAEHDALARRFARADEAMKQPLEIPPEGGQHNQWYQCEKCQMALKTVDAHHHKCPKCAHVYSGYPFDNVLYGGTHMRNAYRMEDAAWAWAATGEKKYAEFAARVLLEYAERYLKYPMLTASIGKKDVDVSKLKGWGHDSAGHMFEQTLNESMWMIPLVTSYDLIHDAGVLGDADREKIETELIRATADNIAKNRMGKSNWQTWHNAALLWAGAVLGDEALVRTALLDPENGFATQMKISVMPEGMWFENSWGYHYYTLSAMTHLAEGSRRLGIDLWGHPMLRKMYLLAFDYRMSDGSLPRFGDAVQSTLYANEVNEPAYAVYRDQRILPVLHFKPSWLSILYGRDVSKRAEMPASQSKLFTGAGHAILHTDGPGKLSAAVSFGPYGGFHGHFDKQSLVFFGHGQELAVDPGRAKSQAYRLPIHTQWYKSTVGHNTVLVDGEDQQGATGELIAFKATPSYAAVVTGDGEAYADVEHKRFLLLTPTYLLVIDELSAGKEHTFEWLYHNKGAGVVCDLPQGQGKLTAAAGYKYLQDVKAFAVNKEGQIKATFPAKGLKVHMSMHGLPGDEVFTATGPFRSIEDRAAMIIVRRRGRQAMFVTALEPVPSGATPTVERAEDLRGGVGPAFLVVRGSGRDGVGFRGPIGSRFHVAVVTGDRDRKEVLSTEKDKP